MDRATPRRRNGAICLLLGIGLLTGLTLRSASRAPDLNGRDPSMHSYTKRASAAHSPAGFVPATHTLQGPLPRSLIPDAGRREALDFSTYLGGGRNDQGTALALDADRNVYLTGWTESNDFPTTPGAYETERQGIRDAFVMKLTQPVGGAWMLDYARRLVVPPDSVGLIARQTQPFAAEGFDQFAQPVTVMPQWTATGGMIDSTGLYTAGDDAGLFMVTAADPATGIEAPAAVNIFSGVSTEDADLPTAFALYSNYPNPFNPETVIRFDVKAPARVVLTLYDVLGRKQATLVEKDYAPGRYEVAFDGRGWPSGLNFYAIEMGDFRDVKQMILVR